SDKSLLRRVRVDRRHYGYADAEAGANRVLLRFRGISIDDRFAARRGELIEFLLDKGRAAWPDLVGLGGRVEVGKGAVVFYPHASLRLQEKIATVEALDGVAMHASAYFDAEGRLALRGVWRVRDKEEQGGPWGRKAQERELNRVVDEVLPPKRSPLVT